MLVFFISVYTNLIFSNYISNYTSLRKMMQAHKRPKSVVSFSIFILYVRLWTVKINASVCSGHLDWWVIDILIQHNTQHMVINHGNNWND